jgi:hypothetical protein
MRRVLEMENLKRMTLAILYEEFVHDLSLEMSAADVGRYLPGYPSNAIRFALDSLDDEGFVRERGSTSRRHTGLIGTNVEEIFKGSGQYKLTDQGIKQVAGWKISDFEAIIAFITPTPRLVGARSKIADRAALTERTIDRIETVDGRPLPEPEREISVDRSASGYAEAIKSLDAALKAFAEDQKGDNRFGKDRSELIATLTEGRKLLDMASVKLSDVVAKLIAPIRALMTRHQGEMVNATTSAFLATALHAIMKLFGIG